MKLLASLVLFIFAGCSSFPPLTVGAGFFGATVSVSTPGWSKPVPVIQSQALTKATLLVPETSPIADELVASTPNGAVPVVVAPVKTETLALPVKQ